MFKEVLTEAGKGYQVTWGDGENIQTFETKKPSFAIQKWVSAQREDPMNVEIFAMSKSDIQPFYDWIQNNTETFVKMTNRQGSYKPKYLYQETQTVNIQKLNIDEALPPFTAG